MRNNRMAKRGRGTRRPRIGRYAVPTVLGGAVVALVAVQWPEIQRYLKISRM
jgi:hypothetical protein